MQACMVYLLKFCNHPKKILLARPDVVLLQFTAPQWGSTDGVPVFRVDFASKSSQTIYIRWEMTLKNILMSTF